MEITPSNRRRVDGVRHLVSTFIYLRVDGVSRRRRLGGGAETPHESATTKKRNEKIHRRDASTRRATYKPWTSPAPDRTIDHAFCSPGAAFAGGRVEATDGYLSDHQPVVFEVSFNKT